jgi:hypothetical protein
MKEMFHVWDAGAIFKHILDKLQHENDGLIFTIKAAPYYPGSCEHIFKWKPMHLNTIDFNVVPLPAVPGFENVWQLQTVDGEIFDFIAFSPEEDAHYRGLAQKWQPLVLECFVDRSLEHPALAQLARLDHLKKKEALSAILSGKI